MIVEELQAEYAKSFGKQYHLTQRETEVLEILVMRGYSNKEIAFFFTVALKTIGNQMYEIMRKMGCGSSREVMSLFSKFMLNEQIKKASTSTISPAPPSNGAEQ